MSVEKINGFRAPYRSQTFQNVAGSIANRNGIMSISGKVSSVGPAITLPAFKFIQNGLIVNKTTSTALSQPAMAAPYYLVVTSPTTANNDDLIFSFAKSPQDIDTTEILVASYDGYEWRTPTLVTIDGVYDDVNASNLDFENVGALNGLITDVVGATLTLSPGVVVDSQGLRQKLDESASFTMAANDLLWPRVDRAVYRRARDSENRVGLRKYLVGGTYSETPVSANETQVFDATKVRGKVKTVIASDNTAHIFAASGYGGSSQLSYTKISSNRQTVVVAATDLFSFTSGNFDVAIDGSDGIHVVYADGGNIKWRKFTTAGLQSNGPGTIDTQSTDCDLPSISANPFSSKVYVTYQSLLGPSNNNLFFTSLTLGGATATAAINVSNSPSNHANSSVFVSDDLWVFLAWEDVGLGRIMYRVFDDIGVPMTAAANISGATDRIGYATLVDVAKNPKVFVSDNKRVYVAFMQDKGSGDYGVSVWDTGSAYMLDLVSSSENIKRFALHVEPVFSGVGLLVTTANSETSFFKINNRAVTFSLPVALTRAAGLSLARDNLGSMLHAWSAASPGTFVSYGNKTISAIGPTSVVGSLNTIVLSSSQLFVDSATIVPKAGDQLVVTGSGAGNNGTYSITEVALVSLNGINDRYQVTVGTAFSSPQNPAIGVSGEFKNPNGNQVKFVKGNSESFAQAFTLNIPDTDVLLSRVSLPDGTILNYVPGNSGASALDSDLFVIYGNSVSVDWSSTVVNSFTVTNGLKVLDLVNNLSYSVADGSYAMDEGDAIYVTLNEVNLTVTPQVSKIQHIPFGSPIQVLGVVKDGEFQPHLLGTGGISQLNPGEEVVIGENLPTPIRNRLGIVSETAMAPYTSTIGYTASDHFPRAISDTNLMAGQNKHIRLVRAKVSWGYAPGDLEFLTAGFLQVPGTTESRNRIAPQVINLPSDGDVAYVHINRTGAGTNDLTVFVSNIAALALARDTIILARRVGVDLILDSSGVRVSPGSVAYTDEPYGSAHLLKAYQNLFISGGGAVGWEGISGSDTLSWSSDFSIEIAGRSATYSVLAGSVTLADGDAAYIDIPEGTPASPLSVQTSPLPLVPIDPNAAGYSPRIYILFFRRGGSVHGLSDLPDLSSGEVGELGEDLGKALRDRVGFLNETQYQDYSSVVNIALPDNYATALSKLDLTLATIQADLPKESIFKLDGFISATNFVAAFPFSALNTLPDITVYVNGAKAILATDGTSVTGEFKKVSTAEIEFFSPLPTNAVVTVRDERTGGGTVGVGEYNDGQSLGLGTPLFVGKTGVDLLFRSIKSTSPNISVSNTTDEVTISSSAEQNTASNIGTGLGLYKQKTGSDLEFKSVKALGTKLTVSEVGDDIVFDGTAIGDVTAAANIGAGEGNVFSLKDGTTLKLRSLKAGPGISIVESGDEILISITTISAVPGSYFVNYIVGQTSTVVGTGGNYNIGTEKLEVYRNGMLLSNSASAGAGVSRYQEASETSILLGISAQGDEVYTFVNRDIPVGFRTVISGVTGTGLSVPSYTTGNSCLRVWRNGILMNTAGIGDLWDRYTESSTTSVTLAYAAVATDVFVAECGPTPIFRHDVTGLTGTTQSTINAYSIGTARLLVYRNGILMYNSVALNGSVHRYQEASSNSILLEEAALASDVFTFMSN